MFTVSVPKKYCFISGSIQHFLPTSTSLITEFLFPLFSDINLPVLPPGLLIMADQGFDHNIPILVLTKSKSTSID